jgi:fumarate reductase flavoprotein subunit
MAGKGNEGTDVVVIGSGISGLSAALTAAEGGAKVIVFEKQRSFGGSSNFFQGMFAVESEMQRERYITYSRDDAFRSIMEYSHWRANPRLVRTFVDESASTISWLQKNGVEFSEAGNCNPAARTYHVVKGEGAAAIKALVTRAKEKGIDLRAGTPVKSLMKAGNSITGVTFEANGEEVTMAAKAVIVASGGYANNKAWIKKYTGFDLDVNLIPIGNIDKTGDGIRMVWEVGGAEDGMGVVEIFRAGPIGPEFAMKGHIELIATQPDLWVNPQGERFCDETVTFYDTSVGNVNARYKEGFTWSLFDESIKREVIEKGIDRGVGMDNLPGTKPVNFDAEMNAAIERGATEVRGGDSVEELAVKIGVEPTILRATVDEYNGFCSKGHDDLFAKDRKFLRPLRGPKFYAVKCRTVFLGTLGGIKINERTEVVDKKGTAIPGLYAVGFDAAGMWGDGYAIKGSTGASAGFAANSGRIAGKNALKYVGR